MLLTDATNALGLLCTRYFGRQPVVIGEDEATGALIATFDPPLTPAEQATLELIKGLTRTTLDLTPADWALIDARLPALRTFRQQTRSEFMALSATERDRATFDALQDIIAILVAMLRD